MVLLLRLWHSTIPTMKFLSFPLPFLVSYLTSSVVTIAFAKPIDSTLPSNNPVEALVTREPLIPSPLSLRNNPLSKRIHSGILPGGWQYAWDEVLSFNHIPSAAKYLEELYQTIIEELDSDDYEDVLERTVAVHTSAFRLIFQMQDRRLGVPLPVVRQFVLRMLLRTQLGWVTKYKGWIQGPGGVVIDVALELVMPMAASILDSAMDLHGG